MLQTLGITRDGPTGKRAVRLSFAAAAASVLTFIFFLLGQQLRVDGLSVFWPAAGVITSLILLTPGKYRSAIVAGIVLAFIAGNFFGERSPAAWLVLLAGNLAIPFSAMAAIDIVRRFFPSTAQRHLGAKDAPAILPFSLSAVAGIALTGIPMSAALNAIGLTHGTLFTVWTQYFVANAAGVAVVAPVAFAIRSRLFEALENGSPVTIFTNSVPWSIRQRLVVLVAVLALPMNCLIVGAIAYFASLTREAEYRSLEYATQSVAHAVDAQLSQYLLIGSALSRSPSLLQSDISAFRDEASRVFTSPDRAWVLIADADGQQLANLRLSVGQPMPRLGKDSMALQDAAFASREPVISHVFTTVYSDIPVITLVFPIFRQNEAFRTLFITVHVEEFLKLLVGAKMPPGWIAGIIDARGNYVARVPDHARLAGQSAAKGWRAVMNLEGLAEFASREGDIVTNYNAFSRVSDWKVGIGAKKSIIEAPVWQTTRWAVILGALTSIFSLMLAAWVAQRIISPVVELERKAASLVAGQPVAFETELPEARQLWSVLETAVAAREKTVEALERSKTEAQSRLQEIDALYQATPVGLALLDLDMNFIRVNGALAAIHGVPIGDHAGKSPWDIVPSIRQTLESAVRSVAATGNSILDFELIIETQSGRRRFWIASCYPLKERDTVVAIGMTVRDITSEHEANEQIKVLVDEVNHRSKNLLAVVQSVAYHTAKDGDPQTFAKRLMDRIDGLALNQNLLVKNQWRGVKLDDLVRLQLSHFKDLFNRRIKLNGPLVQLNAPATQTLGMAFNELATNAAKYGALSAKDGEVDISWRLVERDGSANIAIEWTESGGPAVEAPARKGFGHTVLVRMVEQSFQGGVEIEYRPTGFRWCVTAPAAEVLDTAPSLPA